MTNVRKRPDLFLEQVRAQREAQLVQIATRVLLRKGCRAFRVQEVTDACGVAKGTCYQHFASQDDLIAAAVRSLDEAFAVRLLSPPSDLTEARQVLEWAVLQAVDAQIVAITQRTQEPRAEALDLNGDAWPCCHSVLPCPYGGAVQSSKALLRWTTGHGSPDRVRPSLRLALLLALVPTYCFGLGHYGKLPKPRTIRSTAQQLVKQLFPQNKPDR